MEILPNALVLAATVERREPDAHRIEQSGNRVDAVMELAEDDELALEVRQELLQGAYLRRCVLGHRTVVLDDEARCELPQAQRPREGVARKRVQLHDGGAFEHLPVGANRLMREADVENLVGHLLGQV